MKARVRILLAVAALLGLVTFPTRAPASVTLTPAHMYGVVRDEAAGWTILDNSTHTPSGLTSVTCLTASGELQITYAIPLVTVGTASVSPDEAYAGKVFMGPSVGLTAIYITFRINGSTVHCSSTLLRINNSNLFIDIWGHAATPATTSLELR